MVFALVLLPSLLQGCEKSLDRKHQENVQARCALLKSYVDPKTLATVPEEFYTYAGEPPYWWRFPLVYPYQILMQREMDDGWLTRSKDGRDPDKGDSFANEAYCVTRLAFDGRCCILQIEEKNYAAGTKQPARWVVFVFSDRASLDYPTLKEAIQAARNLGYSGEEELSTVESHYNASF